METIVCKTCGEAKAESKFMRKGLQKKPALCIACYQKKPEVRDRRARNKQNPKYIERQRQYRQRPDVKARMKNYKRNPIVKEKAREMRQTLIAKEKKRIYRQRPDVKKWYKEYEFKGRRSLNERYVKLIIRGKTQGALKAKDIPAELIEMQRQSLILKRTIKQKQDEQSNNTTDV